MNEGGGAGKQLHWPWSWETLIIILILLHSKCVTLNQSQPSQPLVSSDVKYKELHGLHMISNIFSARNVSFRCSSAPLCRCPQQPSLSLLLFLYLKDISPQVLETARTVTVCDCGSQNQNLSSPSLTLSCTGTSLNMCKLFLFFDFGQVHSCFLRSSQA